MSLTRHGNPADAGAAWSDAQDAYDAQRRTQNWQAARVVAGQATDLADCNELLEMLGIDAAARRPA